MTPILWRHDYGRKEIMFYMSETCWSVIEAANIQKLFSLRFILIYLKRKL